MCHNKTLNKAQHQWKKQKTMKSIIVFIASNRTFFVCFYFFLQYFRVNKHAIRQRIDTDMLTYEKSHRLHQYNANRTIEVDTQNARYLFIIYALAYWISY